LKIYCEVRQRWCEWDILKISECPEWAYKKCPVEHEKICPIYMELAKKGDTEECQVVCTPEEEAYYRRKGMCVLAKSP